MKKMMYYTSVLVFIGYSLLSCNKKVDEPYVEGSIDSTIQNQVVMPGKDSTILYKGVFSPGSLNADVNTFSYYLVYNGMSSDMLSGTQIEIRNTANNSTVYTSPVVQNPRNAQYFYRQGFPNGKVILSAGQKYTIIVRSRTSSAIADNASVIVRFEIDYYNAETRDNPHRASPDVKTTFLRTITGSLQVTINPVTSPKVITFGLPSQTISGTFTSVGAPVRLHSLRIAVPDSNFVGVINLYVNGLPQGVYTKTGMHSLVVPITINGTVTFSIDIAPTISAANALLQTTISEVSYLDASGSKKVDGGSYVGGVAYGFFSVPTVRRNTIANTTIIDAQQREFVNVSLSSDTYKQFTVAFRFVDNVNTNADSMRIDSMQLLINGSPVVVNFSVGGVNKKYITKRDSLVTITFATGVSELVLQSTSTLSLVGIPKYFGKSNGNGLQVQFLTDAAPPPVGYNKLFNLNGLGPVVIGSSASASTLPYMIWSTNSAGVGHSSLPGYSSNDWCTSWMIGPLAPYTFYVQ